MAGLPTRTLGRTGMEVTALGYGAMELRGQPLGRPVADDEAGRLLNMVLDAGINLVDTSIDYGVAEELIGRHISHRREEFFLTGKCGCDYTLDATARPSASPHDYRRDNVVGGVEQTLRRCRTDYLDVLQLHLSPSREVLERDRTIETLRELQQAGKVRFIGVSGTLPELGGQIDLGVFDVFQIPYSALDREHEDLIARAAAAGGGTIVRGGAGRGVPSGEPRAVERNADLARAWERADLEPVLDGMSPMEFTLRYTITHADVHCNIAGTIDAEHLRANIAFVDRGPLPADLYAEANRRLAAAGVVPAGAGA